MGARTARGVCMLSSESAPRGCRDHGRLNTGFQHSQGGLFGESLQNWEPNDFEFELLKYFFIKKKK